MRGLYFRTKFILEILKTLVGSLLNLLFHSGERCESEITNENFGQPEDVPYFQHTNLSDSYLLNLVKDALRIESENPHCDIKTYGSVILNLLRSIQSKTIDMSNIGFKIAASLFRRKMYPSNEMRYYPDEKLYWNFFRNLHREAPIRTLSGRGNYGSIGLGKYAPEDADINLAIPSLKTRKEDPSAISQFKTKPGFVESSVEALLKANITDVSLSLDEKSLSQGVMLIEPTTVEEEFSLVGDVDYFFPEINQHKDELLYHLNYWQKISPVQHVKDAFLHLSSLVNKLYERKLLTRKKLRHLKSNTKQNITSITKESSNLAVLDSCLRDVFALKGDMMKHVLFAGVNFEEHNKEGCDGLTVKLQACRHDYTTQVPSYSSPLIPVKHVSNLCGLHTMDVMKSSWRSVFDGHPVEIDEKQDEDDHIGAALSIFLKLYDENLEIVKHENMIQLHYNINFVIESPSLIKSKDLNCIEYVHVHCEEVNDQSLLQIMILIDIFKKPGFLTVRSEHYLEIITIETSEQLTNIVMSMYSLLATVSSKAHVPKRRDHVQLSECKKLFAEFVKPKPYAQVPLILEHVEIKNEERSPENTFFHYELSKPDKTIEGAVGLILQNNYLDVLKRVTVALSPPALHILVVVATSMYGITQGNHLSDIPVFWCCTGIGVSVKTHVKCILDKVKEYLSHRKIRVTSVSGDTAFSPILSLTQASNHN